MTIYRRIYEQHHGPIPIDENGRTYDIHHIDGNRKNNDPKNLVALSVKDHYNIHHRQGDWYACLLISKEMNMLAEEKSEISRRVALERSMNGTNPLSGPEMNRKMLCEGIHPTQQKKQCECCGKEVTLPVYGRYHGKKCGMKRPKREWKYEDVKCPHCGLVGSGGNMKRYHFDNCKYRMINDGRFSLG